MTAVLEEPATAAPERSTPPRSRAAWWVVPPLLVVLCFVVYPLLRVCLASTKPNDAKPDSSTWGDVLGSQAFVDALWRTVAIAATSTLGCLILGTFLAIVLAFVPFPSGGIPWRGTDRVLTRITLPLLLPALGAAAGLAVALSMGELGATVMVYPATWKTLPVTIFALTDRGQAFQAAACTTILLVVTLLALVLLGRIRGRAALR